MITALQLAQVRNNHWLTSLFTAYQAQLTVISTFATGAPLTSTRFKSLTLLDQMHTGSPAASFVDRGAGLSTKGQLNFGLQELEACRLGFVVDAEESTMLEFNQELAQNPAGNGLDYFTKKAMNATYSELRGLERQIFYGTTVASKGFLGLKQICSYTSGNVLATTDIAQDSDYAKSVINAGGSTSSTASSVYAVRFGDEACQLRLGGPGTPASNAGAGLDGFLNLPQPTRVQRESGGTYSWYHTASVEGWAALSVCGSSEAYASRVIPQYAVRRAANLTQDSGKGLTDLVMERLVASFPDGMAPDIFYMSRRSQEQLRDARDTARTVYVTGGAGARNTFNARSELPAEWDGIPIVTTSVIGNTDAIES